MGWVDRGFVGLKCGCVGGLMCAIEWVGRSVQRSAEPGMIGANLGAFLGFALAVLTSCLAGVGWGGGPSAVQ